MIKNQKVNIIINIIINSIINIVGVRKWFPLYFIFHTKYWYYGGDNMETINVDGKVKDKAKGLNKFSEF